MRSKEPTEPPRKRSRTSEDADDVTFLAGGKKARGRPRVDTQDATAADRRRTQIRLAQRAYRQRKETTISSLKQQSTQLHAVIDEMNRTFLRFHESIVQSGVLRLKPELARDLKQATETFTNCVTTANERPLDSDEDELREVVPQKLPDFTANAAKPKTQSNHAITPETALLNYVFKLSLPYLTLDEIRARFKTILARGVTEDLDWYATPFVHLGGAGTHYERRDAQGKPIPFKNTWTIRQTGPFEKHTIRLESVADGQIRDLEGVDLAGFEGEWFDAYDVQGYLEEQWHCKIDPKSSFAECIVEDETGTSSDNETGPPSLTRGSTAGTPDNSPPPIPSSFNSFEPSYGLDMRFSNAPASNFIAAPARPGLIDLSYDQTLGLDLAPDFSIGFDCNGSYSTLGLDMMNDVEQLPVVKQKPKKVAWVDVSKLVDKMIKRAVCLGRAPGYRRKDVDLAFREALISAF
ncbi:hypothetical protein E8E12_008802 [Didymella heteroderae]|uniref:Uncharacterized protein n=1 Tax=Didymella heteroderae TaxID=1769908 RepID=A0A9P4WU27_9PLEO|nr:hypothetical protein E8E12_008802 [Didymella heteroderae]